ncbi:Caffeic acid 3-O-methyltransferase [Ancistrocladus abbreviatus]
MNPDPVGNSQEEIEACAFAMRLTSGSVLPMVLKAAIELDLLEIIKKGGPGAHLSAAEIAGQLPTKNPKAAAMLDRMLRVLVTYSVLTCSTGVGGERLYGLAPVCKFLTKSEDGACLAPLHLLVQDKPMLDSWHGLKDAVLEGGTPFDRVHGMDRNKYAGSDPRHMQIIVDAVSGHSALIMKKLLQTYDGLEGLSSIVQVRGGLGASLKLILSKYPSIKGINFDLPNVVAEAPPYPGVEHVGGDPKFTSIPKGDAIFMEWICHNYLDEECVKLLKNCYAALPEHGKVIVCEYVLPDVPETTDAAKIAADLDGLMLTVSGGIERTEKEYKALGKAAGFQGFKVACSAYEIKVMEFLKTK